MSDVVFTAGRPCPVCNNNRIGAVGRRDGTRWVNCSRCGTRGQVGPCEWTPGCTAAAIGTRWNVDRKLSPSPKLDVPVCDHCFGKDR